MKSIQEWVVVIVFAILFIAFIVIQPGMEASTFNKLTGGEATYWDAFLAI